jgi:antitoxin component YwqK of YwqJK toxin-antitoxin module
MTIRNVLLCFIIILFSCKQREISAIEIMKFDDRLIDTLKKTSDTTYSNFIGRHDFYTADFYVIKKDSVITKILKDSVGNVVGLNRSKNGIVFFAAEYYPNGQIIGKTQFKLGTVDGPATYYYSDGRIKSKGQWHDYAQVGIWKDYKENGELQATIYYDTNGKIIKTDSLK